MARPARTISDKLRRRAKSLDRYLARQEDLYGARCIPLPELKYGYIGAYLNFYVEIESSLEELFLGLLMGRIAPMRSEVRPLVSIKSDVVARKVLCGERSFVDWLPYDKTTSKRARAFFASGAPFSKLNKRFRDSLEGASIIRNAVAHRSSAARRRFCKHFVEGKPLPPSEQSPEGYLRGFHASGQRRISLQFAEVVAALDALCT